LDKNNILDAVKDSEGAQKYCSTELGGFEQNCASSWVSGYFLTRLSVIWSFYLSPTTYLHAELKITSSYLTLDIVQVLYFKQRRVAEYEKEQLLKRQEAEMFPTK
jgi:hypothetical protein